MDARCFCVVACVWAVGTSVFGLAQAAVLEVSDYPLIVDADAGDYRLQDGVVLAPFYKLGGQSVSSTGAFSPSVFGGNEYQGGDFIDGSDDEAQGWSGSWAADLSAIGYLNQGFEIAYDMNTTGKVKTLGFQRIRVEIDGAVIWDLDAAALGVAEALSFNSETGCGPAGDQACTQTAKANSSGVDFVLQIPFSLVVERMGNGAASGASQLSFRWVQVGDAASDDQWELMGDAYGERLAPGDVISVNAVPLPPALALLPAGMAGLVAARRRAA